MDLRTTIAVRDALEVATEGSPELDKRLRDALELADLPHGPSPNAGPTQSLDAALAMAFAKVPGLISYTLTGGSTGPTVVELYTGAMPLSHSPADYIVTHQADAKPALAVCFATFQALARLEGVRRAK
jgi:hypothetical protein